MFFLCLCCVFEHVSGLITFKLIVFVLNNDTLYLYHVSVSRDAPVPTVLIQEANNNKVPITFKVLNNSDVPRYMYIFIPSWTSKVRSSFFHLPSHHDFRIFQIIVGEGGNAGIDENQLLGYNNASAMDIPYYIAAQLNHVKIGLQRFIIGDGHVYGNYENVKLGYGHLHNVWIRAIFITADEVIELCSFFP